MLSTFPTQTKRLFEKCFTVTLGTLRSPLTHASRSTWGNPIAFSVSPWEKTALAPLKKRGNRNQSPPF
jgi:hypothetical protein